MAVAIARLGGGGRVDVPINLLPPEVLARQRMRKVFTGLLVGLGAVGLVLIALTLLQLNSLRTARNELTFQQAEAAKLQTQVNALSEFGQMQARIDGSKAALASSLKNDVAWSVFLADLAVTMPDDASLSGLSMTAVVGTTPEGQPSLGTVKYQGTVRTFSGGRRLSVEAGLAGWLTRMAELKGLRFVYLNNGSKAEGGEVSFAADAHLTETMLSGRCQGVNAPCP